MTYTDDVEQLVGIEIFILLFRSNMLLAWRSFLSNLFHRARTGRPPTPELTSLEMHPDAFITPPSPLKRNPYVSAFSATTADTSSGLYSSGVPTPRDAERQTEMGEITRAPNLPTVGGNISRRPVYDRMTSDAVLLPPAASFQGQQQGQFSAWDDSSADISRTASPAPSARPFGSPREAPTPPARSSPPDTAAAAAFPPPARAQSESFSPPVRSMSNASKASKRSMGFFSRKERPKSHAWALGTRSVGGNGGSRSKEGLSSVRGRMSISHPIPGSFVHVDGLSKGAGISGGNGSMASVGAGSSGERRDWPGEADSWDQERASGKFI